VKGQNKTQLYPDIPYTLHSRQIELTFLSILSFLFSVTLRHPRGHLEGIKNEIVSVPRYFILGTEDNVLITSLFSATSNTAMECIIYSTNFTSFNT